MALPELPGYVQRQTPTSLYIRTDPPTADPSSKTHFDLASFYKKCEKCNNDIPSNSPYNYCGNCLKKYAQKFQVFLFPKR